MRLNGFEWVNWGLPSTLPMARMLMVLMAGSAHAARWKYCEMASMASWPHFSPAAKNHVTVNTTHQMDDAIPKKYSTMNRMVHSWCLVPCRTVDTVTPDGCENNHGLVHDSNVTKHTHPTLSRYSEIFKG